MISHISSSHLHHDKNNDKMQKYIQGLEAERQKIRVFERELPLCLQLVTQAIEDCKQKHLGKEGGYTISDCSESEQTSTEEPINSEEFIRKKSSVINIDNNDKGVSNKSEWLRSTQLWNQTADPPSPEKDFLPKKVLAMEVNRNGIGGAFHPFKKGDAPLQPIVKTGYSLPSPAVAVAVAVAAGSSTAETGGSNGGKSIKEGGEKESESKRKTRRSWSPELHKRFMRALEQLGGSNVATPKQIRELMKVDGLTNDEVKSHLQKYRLHNRRSSSSIHNNNPQQPQFVVVGGIWVPPPEYAAAMATTTNCGGAAASNGIYAPIATLATPFDDASTSAKHKHRPRTCNNDSDHNSQASSSSSETTTTSPDC